MHTSMARNSLFAWIIQPCNGFWVSKTQRTKLQDGWRSFKDMTSLWTISLARRMRMPMPCPDVHALTLTASTAPIWSPVMVTFHNQYAWWPRTPATWPSSLETFGILQQAQQNDDDLCPVIEWLKADADRPCWEDVASFGGCTKAYWAQWDSLQLVDGMLYRLWETPAGDDITQQLVVPKAIQGHILWELHSTITAGHFRVAKTTSCGLWQIPWVCRLPVAPLWRAEVWEW